MALTPEHRPGRDRNEDDCRLSAASTCSLSSILVVDVQSLMPPAPLPPAPASATRHAVVPQETQSHGQRRTLGSFPSHADRDTLACMYIPFLVSCTACVYKIRWKKLSVIVCCTRNLSADQKGMKKTTGLVEQSRVGGRSECTGCPHRTLRRVVCVCVFSGC